MKTIQQTIREPERVELAAEEQDWKQERFDLLGFFARIAVQWPIIASITALFLVGSTVAAFLMKPYYESMATFMPPVRDLSPFAASSSAASQMISISGLGVGPGATYLGLLYSRSVQDSVAEILNVRQTFHLHDADEARGFVASKTRFDVQTNGIMIVICRDESPEFAAKLADAYLEALYRLNQRMSAATLMQRRVFYDEELKGARGALEKAEANLIATQERGGILDPGSTTQVAISNQARLLGSIQAAEVQLTVLGQSQTADSPEVVRLRSQISQLRAQLTQQQTFTAGAQTRGLQAGGALPKLSLENTRSLREMREQEAIYEALLRQTDIAKMSETDPGPQLQVIDRAIVPLKKAGPSRKNIILAGTAAGFFLSLLYVSTFSMARRIYGLFLQKVRAQGNTKS